MEMIFGLLDFLKAGSNYFTILIGPKRLTFKTFAMSSSEQLANNYDDAKAFYSQVPHM
jgi:hypothetical protein